MKNILVTGGAGFIGSHLVEALIERGFKVKVLDSFITGKRANLRSVRDKIQLIEGDFRDLAIAKKAAREVDYIFHLGALPKVTRSVEQPLLSHQINSTGTLNILLAARDQKVKRVIFASSSSVYGDTPVLPKIETMPPGPISPYAVQKLNGEHYCRLFYQLYGLPTVILRYFNVFGPRQDPSHPYAAVIPRFISLMKTGRRPTIYGDGKQSRDFTYIDNVVEGTLSALNAKAAGGEVINLACGGQISLNQLVSLINRSLKTKIKPIYAKPRPGDFRHSRASITKAKKILDYRVKVSFEEGLRRMIEE